MEVSSVDPKLGGTFYFIEQEKVRRPKFVRSNDCLSCHDATRNQGVIMTVLIAGGGIGGLTLALSLHQIGVPAKVFECRCQDSEHHGGNGR